MKTRSLSVFFSLAAITLFGQGIQPPAKGKAVIYFTRVSSMGFAIPFDFFHNKKYIGQFAGKNYMRYECDPGEQLFWASSENKEFMTAELKAGDTYIVVVEVETGIEMAHVGFTPIHAHHKNFERAKKLIDLKPPKRESDEGIKKENARLAGFIDEKLKQYHDTWKNEKNFQHLSSSMAIPAESF